MAATEPQDVFWLSDSFKAAKDGGRMTLLLGQQRPVQWNKTLALVNAPSVGIESLKVTLMLLEFIKV